MLRSGAWQGRDADRKSGGPRLLAHLSHLHGAKSTLNEYCTTSICGF
jgi:hypothetical protein